MYLSPDYSSHKSPADMLSICQYVIASLIQDCHSRRLVRVIFVFHRRYHWLNHNNIGCKYVRIVGVKIVERRKLKDLKEVN